MKKKKRRKTQKYNEKKKSFGFVFLFKINSDLNSYDFFVFNSIFYFFYLVKINKLFLKNLC